MRTHSLAVRVCVCVRLCVCACHFQSGMIHRLSPCSHCKDYPTLQADCKQHLQTMLHSYYVAGLKSCLSTFFSWPKKQCGCIPPSPIPKSFLGFFFTWILQVLPYQPLILLINGCCEFPKMMSHPCFYFIWGESGVADDKVSDSEEPEGSHSLILKVAGQ